MEENRCPSCDSEFDKKLVFNDGVDFSVSADDRSLDKVCMFQAYMENWVYLHLDDSAVIEETFEFSEEREEPPDLSGFIETLDEGLEERNV